MSFYLVLNLKMFLNVEKVKLTFSNDINQWFDPCWLGFRLEEVAEHLQIGEMLPWNTAPLGDCVLSIISDGISTVVIGFFHFSWEGQPEMQIELKCTNLLCRQLFTGFLANEQVLSVESYLK